MTGCRLLALVRQWIPVHTSVLFMLVVDIFLYEPLYLAIPVRCCLPEEYLCGFFSGDDFWISFHIQRFLVRQWIHASSSLRRLCSRILRSILVLLSLSPYTAHCLVLCDTCSASVYGMVEFHVFLREYHCLQNNYSY